MYNAFGWQHPEFAHVALLVDENRQKLSKRIGDVNLTVSAMKDQGILPEVLLNYSALLGWSHKQRSDIMSLKELVKYVSSLI